MFGLHVQSQDHAIADRDAIIQDLRAKNKELEDKLQTLEGQFRTQLDSLQVCSDCLSCSGRREASEEASKWHKLKFHLKVSFNI